jgi:small GTP-binding protein
VKNAFHPAGTASTVGASFVTKRVLDSASDTIVRLQIWDTAGQERFRSISRLYYRGANACLLCYDITDEQSFQEMTGWLLELKKNLGDEDPVVIHVVGTKSDIVALEPSRRRVPFERTIAYVAEQLYPSQASTPPPTAGVSHSSSITLQGPDSKRSSGFWGQDIGWDCCHEISAKDGEGIEEVFQVITRKLVEQRNKQLGITSSQGSASGVDGLVSPVGPGTLEGNGSFRLGPGDKRRSWLGFPPSSVGDELDERVEIAKKKGKCC